MNKMDVENRILSTAGKGKGRYYILSQGIHRMLAEDVRYQSDGFQDEESMKTKIMNRLKIQPLSNQEIRQMTGLTPQQVRKLMADMEKDGVYPLGKGRGARYALKADETNE